MVEIVGPPDLKTVKVLLVSFLAKFYGVEMANRNRHKHGRKGDPRGRPANADAPRKSVVSRLVVLDDGFPHVGERCE